MLDADNELQTMAGAPAARKKREKEKEKKEREQLARLKEAHTEAFAARTAANKKRDLLKKKINDLKKGPHAAAMKARTDFLQARKAAAKQSKVIPHCPGVRPCF